MPSRALRTTALALAASSFAIAAAPAGAADLETWQRAAHTGSFARAPKPAGDAPIICVVDTGVDLVPSVQGNVIGRETLLADPDVGDGSFKPEDPATGHGTYVTQVALATWPWARIYSVRIGDATGALAPLYRQALETCSARGANVINLSIGAKTAPSAAEKTALASLVKQTAVSDDIDVVAAAGNNDGPVNWPAAGLTTTGVAVAAFDEQSRYCSWASHGPEVLIGAAACEMRMAATHHNVRMVMTGSSFAAPQVSAVLAALQAYRPDLTAAQRRELISGLEAGMLDGDEILRRAGLAHLITDDPPLPVPVVPTVPVTPVTPEAPVGTGVEVDEVDPEDSYFTNADEIDDAPRKPRLALSWKGKRLLVRAINAPSRSRLVVKVGSSKKKLQARSTRLYVPVKLSKAKARVVVRLVSRSGRTVLTRTFKAPRHR